jgi:hypothetical protein
MKTPQEHNPKMLAPYGALSYVKLATKVGDKLPPLPTVKALPGLASAPQRRVVVRLNTPA